MSRWVSPLAGVIGTLSRGARRDIEARTPVPLTEAWRTSSSVYFPASCSVAAGYLTYMQTYSEDGVVYPIVARLAESVSEARWKLWTKPVSGMETDRTVVTTHPVLDLFDHPNDFQSMPEIFESAQQHFELVGEHNIILGFLPGVSLPIDMWVLRPDRIEPRPSAENFLDGWVYTAPGGMEKIPIETRELMRQRRPAPTDPYRGQGAIQALLRDLDAQKYTKEWQSEFFQNSARPGGVIQVDRHLSDPQWDELRQRWHDSHAGLSKAHRVAVLEHGATWQEASFSLRDLQIAELDSVGRDKALVAFGMPKSMLGIVEDVNRANAEAGEYLYARWMVRPRLARWKAMLNRQLLPLYGDRTAKSMELDFADPVPENGEQALAELTAKSTALVSLVGAGFDAAQVLEMLDWPELGYEKPAPAVVQGPPGQGGEGGIGALRGSSWPDIDGAMRWQVRGHPDSNICEPCRKNIGKLYRNRSSAYADYPGGRGYIKCVGARYGNRCRCVVLKRRAES